MSAATPVRYIDAITHRYELLGFSPYRWFEADSSPPFEALSKPIAQSKIGVLATSGTYVAGQVAYHYKDDTSLRAIPKDTTTRELRFAHITENYLQDSRRDPNCTFPIEALRALEAQQRIGELAEELFSCMGGIYSQRRVREELIPAVQERFEAQQVDAVLLVPM